MLQNARVTAFIISQLLRENKQAGISPPPSPRRLGLKGFKFVAKIVLVFKKIGTEDKTKYGIFHSSSNAKIITNESDIDDVFQSIYTKIITNRQKPLGKGSGWIFDSVIDHTISISKYNPLAGSSSIKLPKELDHPRKVLINIQNIDDNECFKWCLVRYLDPADHDPTRIKKADNRDIHKIKKKKRKKKRILSALAFLVMTLTKIVQSMYQDNVVKKTMLTYY